MRAKIPEKPYKDFPLTAHPTGTWCKKIKGKFYHFGPWYDPEASLAKYRQRLEMIQDGRKPELMPVARPVTMDVLCSRFLATKEKLFEIGELSYPSWLDFKFSCERLLEVIGQNKVVERIKPKDFDHIRDGLAKNSIGENVSRTTHANRIRITRIVFKFAIEQEFIVKPIEFGKNVKHPVKIPTGESQHKPSKAFTSDELRAIIDETDIPLRGMILLGINAGFANAECAALPLSAVDLERGWIHFSRSEAGIERRCPLWMETVDALRETLANRPKKIEEANVGLLFVTKFGKRFVRLSENGINLDAISGEFLKVLVHLQMNGDRRAFYSLRRTFEVIAGETGDHAALSAILGQSPADDVSTNAAQHVDDARLKAVTEHVRRWLWPMLN